MPGLPVRSHRLISVFALGSALLFVGSLAAGEESQTIALPFVTSSQTISESIDAFDPLGGTRTLVAVRLELLTVLSGGITTTGTGGTANYEGSGTLTPQIAGAILLSSTAAFDGTIDNSGGILSALLFDDQMEEVTLDGAFDLALFDGPDPVEIDIDIDFASMQTPAGLIQFDAAVSGELSIVYDFVTSLPFVRGDVNGDGATDVADVVTLLGSLFTDGPDLPCLSAADANDSGVVDIADGIYVLSLLFSAGDPIPPPVGACGLDPTPDALDCATPPTC